jgi:glycerophosphoryl diester phosphodiesterase
MEPQTLQRPLEYVVDLVHQSGREFLAWCPGPEFAQKLLDAGVDALCVNNVPNALAALRTTAQLG